MYCMHFKVIPVAINCMLRSGMEMELKSFELSWTIVEGSICVVAFNFLLKTVELVIIVDGCVANISVIVMLWKVVNLIKIIWLNVHLGCMTIEEAYYVTGVVVFLNYLVLVRFNLWVLRVAWSFWSQQINRCLVRSQALWILVTPISSVLWIIPLTMTRANFFEVRGYSLIQTPVLVVVWEFTNTLVVLVYSTPWYFIGANIKIKLIPIVTGWAIGILATITGGIPEELGTKLLWSILLAVWMPATWLLVFAEMFWSSCQWESHLAILLLQSPIGTACLLTCAEPLNLSSIEHSPGWSACADRCIPAPHTWISLTVVCPHVFQTQKTPRTWWISCAVFRWVVWVMEWLHLLPIRLRSRRILHVYLRLGKRYKSC